MTDCNGCNAASDTVVEVLSSLPDLFISCLPHCSDHKVHISAVEYTPWQDHQDRQQHTIMASKGSADLGKRVRVTSAGVLGLVATKILLAQRFGMTCLERKGYVGSLWHAVLDGKQTSALAGKVYNIHEQDVSLSAVDVKRQSGLTARRLPCMPFSFLMV
jgi:hypothetical protein